MSSLTDYANNYIKNGLYITQVYINTNSEGYKTVNFPKNWLNNLRKTTVQNWSGNIAIATGHGNDCNVCVLDVDSPSHRKDGVNGLESIEKWQKEHGAFPDTRIAETPTGGRHYYFKVPQDIHIKRGSNLLPGVDVQGDKACVIAPPSVYNSKRYKWINHTKIAEANDSVLDLMRLNQKGRDEEVSSLPQSSQDLNMIQEGGRTTHLVSMIGQQNFTSNKASKEAIKAMIRAENEMYCNPPLSEEELERQVFPAVDNLPLYEKKNTDTFTLPQAIKASDLMQMYIPPIEWLVKDMLPNGGIAMLTSPPKCFKSFMALDLGLSIAEGKPFLGKETTPHGVLYMDLESTKRRPRDRLKMILKDEPAPDNFYLLTAEDDIKTLEHGFEQQLENFLRTHEDVKLVTIDIFQKIREDAKRTQTGYSKDYADMAILKKIATEFNVCILLVHHNRKLSDKDPFNEISGSTGTLGSLDTCWIIQKKREDPNGVLIVTGRDIAEQSFILRFDKDTWKWEYIGTQAEMFENIAQKRYMNSPITIAIKKLLEENPDGWTGSAQEIKNFSVGLPQVINETPQSIGKFISENIVRFKNDDIKIEKNRNGKNRHISLSLLS